MAEYRERELRAVYELGRMYFEMGYYAPAERIFAGLATVDKGLTPAHLGLGLVKLENGLNEEAMKCFRKSLDTLDYELSAKVALGLAFMAEKEHSRARGIFDDLKTKNSEALAEQPQIQALFNLASKRVDVLLENEEE